MSKQPGPPPWTVLPVRPAWGHKPRILDRDCKMKSGGFPHPSNLNKFEYEKLLTSVSDRLCIGGVSLSLECYFRSLAEADESRMRRPGNKWHGNCLPQRARTPGKRRLSPREDERPWCGSLDPEDWTGFRAQTHD